MLGPWERHSMELSFPNRSQAAGLLKRHNDLFQQRPFKWQCIKGPPTCVSLLPQALISPNLRPIGWLTCQRNLRELPYHYFLSGAMLGITDKMEAHPNPLSSSRRHGPGMKELGLVILTCSFLSSVDLAGKNVKVLERSMRKHKAFYSCAQKIIYKITIDICSRIFAKNVPGWARRPQLEDMGRIIIWDLFVRGMFMAKEVCWV